MDVRVICATNVNLGALVEAKQFRMDLFYRLEVFPIELPTLQARVEDVEQLAQHFLSLLSEEAGMPQKRISDASMDLLKRRAWQGNVRELQHAMERAFILSGDEMLLRAEHFPQSGMESSSREHARRDAA